MPITSAGHMAGAAAASLAVQGPQTAGARRRHGARGCGQAAATDRRGERPPQFTARAVPRYLRILGPSTAPAAQAFGDLPWAGGHRNEEHGKRLPVRWLRGSDTRTPQRWPDDNTAKEKRIS